MPHNMKKIGKICILVLAAVGMWACNDEYQSTPVIVVDRYVYLTHQDGSRDTTMYFGDTLLIGDTARVMMALNGVSHPLKKAQVTSEDAEALACGFECDSIIIADCLEKDSKPEEGYLHFVPEYTMVVVTYRYVAKEAGTYSMKFVLESMAKEGYNHNEGEIVQVIR